MRRHWVVHAALTMVLAATALVFRHDRESERARADALLARFNALESQRSATPAVRPAQPMAQAALVPRVPPPQAADTAAEAITNVHEDYKVIMLRLLRDPKYYEATRASRRLSYAEKRDEMIRVLGLSPTKADAIVDSWIDRHLRTEMRVLKSAVEPELHEQPELWAQQDREADEKLRAAIGDETFEKLQEYTASGASRQHASQLRTRFAASHQELRDDQFEPLVLVLHTETARHQQAVKEFIATQDPDVMYTPVGQRKVQEHMSSLNKATNRRIHDSLAMILSPQQLAIYDAMLREEAQASQIRSTLKSMEASAGVN